MDKYQYIKNPLTNRKVRIDSTLGKRIIRQYVKNMVGGARISESIYYEYKGEKKVEECALCLAKLNNGNALLGLIPCKHIFHKDCVEFLFKKK